RHSAPSRWRLSSCWGARSCRASGEAGAFPKRQVKVPLGLPMIASLHRIRRRHVPTGGWPPLPVGVAMPYVLTSQAPVRALGPRLSVIVEVEIVSAPTIDDRCDTFGR